MPNKNKYLLIFAIIFLLFLKTNFAFALEVGYPPVPGLVAPSSSCTGNDCLSIFIAYWFGLLVYIAGALALISFVVGAVSLIISVDNAEAQSSAKDRMKGAVLGLVLVLSAFIILQTINPKFITPTLTPLPGVAGVFYVKGEGPDEEKPVGIQEPDVANRGKELVDNGFDSLFYKCIPGQESTAPALLIWEFPEPNLEAGNDYNDPAFKNVRINCGETEFIGDLGSFRMAFETPGIYYCLDGCSGNMCTGYMSGPNLTTQDALAEPFSKDIKAIRIVNDLKNNNNYGAIFHSVPGAGEPGDCTEPITTNLDIQCKSLHSFSAFSVDIFNWNNNDPASSGDGMVFYNEPEGWNTGDIAAKFTVAKDDVGGFWNTEAKDIIFNWAGVKSEKTPLCEKSSSISCNDQNAPQANSCCPCKNFQDCPGSLQFKGTYIVAFYTHYKLAGGSQSLYCQTFKKNEDTANLKLEGFLPNSNWKLEYVNIIPIK